MVHDKKVATASRQQSNQLGTNASVVPSTTVRNLGIFIDQSLTMTSQINIVIGRCFNRCAKLGPSDAH